MKAGYNYGETAELFPVHYRVPKAELKPGRYRNITGNEATALGFLAASKLSGRPLFYGSYPITPASDILQELARFKNFGVKTFQAEDEIAAIGSAIGAAFGGSLGLTGTSGPGLALKSEGLGLAVMVELPIVVAVIQRSGPSTGMPTKTEQADLLQAMFGRNGECPVAIVAPATPADCFDYAIEAYRIALHAHGRRRSSSRTATSGTGSEPWRLPDVSELPKIEVNFATDKETFHPYARDPKTLARQWAVPGHAGAGAPDRRAREVGHHRQRQLRRREPRPDGAAARGEGRAHRGRYSGPAGHTASKRASLLVLGWGSTYGADTVGGAARSVAGADRSRARTCAI